VEERLDAILKEVKAIQVNQVRSATTVGELTSWSKKADVMAAELKSDIQDLKSCMVALETLSTTPPKILPPEEEGWARGHLVDKKFQGGD
jgi:predicted RNA-binding protein with EMAP domain